MPPDLKLVKTDASYAAYMARMVAMEYEAKYRASLPKPPPVLHIESTADAMELLQLYMDDGDLPALLTCLGLYLQAAGHPAFKDFVAHAPLYPPSQLMP